MAIYNCSKCNKVLKDDAINDSEWFPFCSERCKMSDLGAWFSGEYAILGKVVGLDDIPEEPLSQDDEDLENRN